MVMPLYPEIELKIKLENISGNHEIDRNALRTLVLDRLVEEKAGTGKGENISRYRYNVESLSCGNRIYLTRPVMLNKGFDFVIHVENYTFINGKDNPKHVDILKDLIIKQQEGDAKYKHLLSLINFVFLCTDPTEILPKLNEHSFANGFPVDMILKVLKWLFIEQDIRYWNFSGRNMFMDKIREI